VNVLFIHEVDWLKKVVFDIHTLAESLSLRGHNVYAIDYENTWSRDGFFDLGTLKTTEIAGVSRAFPNAPVTLVRPGFIKIPGLSRLSAYCTHRRVIKRIIKEKAIDAVVLYSAATNGRQALNAARKFNIPVIYRSIDILNQLVRYPFLRGPTRFFEKTVHKRADMILTLTPGLTKYVAENGADAKKVHLLPMPVDTGIFHPFPAPDELCRKWGITKADKIILFMGTLFDFSGLDLLIPLLPEIIGQVPGAKLLIVGDGPQRKMLESIIAEAGVGDKVIITGFEPYDTMPQYINMADVCLNSFQITGATRDIFPGKIVQYLACAKAVVATPLPGLVAVTPGEDEGIVFAGAPSEMAEKLVGVLQDNNYRQRLEKNGLAYVKKRHSCESIARQLEARLQEAIDKKRNPAG
jgi:glycosyltransferase involved in cell wall biosynthesis